MIDEPSPGAEARALAQEAPEEGFRGREAIFGLFVSGLSHHEIAELLRASRAAVRRIIDSAVGKQLDAPGGYVRMQVARLTKVRVHADDNLERGDMRASGPVPGARSELHRYHSIDARVLPLRPAGNPTKFAGNRP